MFKKFIVVTLGMLSVTASTFGGVVDIGPGTGTITRDKPFCGG